MEEMKRYDSYKDSGIEWIGEIPEHWEVGRIKFYIDYQKGKNPKEFKFTEDEDSEVYLSMDFLRGNPKQILYVENADNYVRVEENEILLLWDGSNAGEFLLSKKGILSSTMAVLNIKDIQNGFSWYFFKHFESNLKESTIGMGIPHVNGEELRNGVITLPLPVEQTSIAAFLNRKTSEIDEIIADKKRLLELYKEEKTAIINQAVTKGLDPNAPMKDSGIEWLGEIPEHWEVKRLKYVAFFQRGHDLSSSNFVDGDIPVFGSNGIIGYHNEYTGLGPSLIVGRSGSVGEVNFVKEPMFWAHNTSLFLLKNYGNDIQFLFFMLKRLDLKSYAAGTAVGSLNRNNIHEIKVVMPHLNEQRAIVHHIETECNKIDTKLSSTEKLIELLTEYRTALISEVVTGKIKVIENCKNNKGASLYYQDH